MDVNIMREYLFDIILIVAALYVAMYIHGEYKYQEGIRRGMRMQRKIDRAIRRGEIYRLK